MKLYIKNLEGLVGLVGAGEVLSRIIDSIYLPLAIVVEFGEV